MSGRTTIKDALQRWEEEYEEVAAEAKEIELYFQWPPIEKMDNSLSLIPNVEKLSLSTNMIEKITGLTALKNLKILSLGRNYIKSLAGLEPVGETLEELWISYNNIEKLKGIGALKKLKVLYISNNSIKEWAEFNKFTELPLLYELVFVGNPLEESMEEDDYRNEVIKKLPDLLYLDGDTCISEVYDDTQELRETLGGVEGDEEEKKDGDDDAEGGDKKEDNN